MGWQNSIRIDQYSLWRKN